MTEYFAGIDIGSRMTKVVVMDETETTVVSLFGETGPEHRQLAHEVMAEALARARLPFEDMTYIVATGYGRINVPFADKQITEITCHARGVGSLIPTARTVIDIGGQDSKGIKLKNGRAVDFVMNDKCAAGTGRFIEVIAESLGVRLEDMGRLSLSAERVAPISSICTVFTEQEVISQLAKGAPVGELIAGIHEAIAARVYHMVARLKIEKDVVLTGGGAMNIGLISALEQKLGYPAIIPPEPLLTGAIGAALLAKEAAQKALSEGLPLARSERHLKQATFFR